MYLFNNTPIQTRFDESDKKIASELNKITDNELLNCDLQKIADRIEQQYSIICDTEFKQKMLSQLVILCPFREKRYDQNYELVQSMSFMILSQSIINSKSKVIILSFSILLPIHTMLL